MTIRHISRSKSIQDLVFRLRYSEDENSRERNARRHSEHLYAGAHPAAKVTALTGYTVPNTARHLGTDTSHWDKNVDEGASKVAGIDFTIIKAMDGTVETKYYRANRERAKAAGLIQGPYAWLYPNNRVSCKLQAQALFELLSSVGFDEVPPTIDWEWTYLSGQPAYPNMTDLQTWADEWLRLSGRKSILYTAAGYARQFGTMPASLREKFAGLWVANYGVSVPAMPPGWLQWDMHQFTASGEAAIWAPNDAGKLEVDLSYVLDSTTLNRLTGGAAPDVPPPDGGSMATKFYRLNTTAANIRAGAGASYPSLGYLTRDDVVQVEEVLGSWSRFVNAQHQDGTPVTVTNSNIPVFLYTGKCWSTNAYFVEVARLPNPPVAEPPPAPAKNIVKAVLHFDDGSTQDLLPQ